ncbi:MAG: SpoIIE family protein phosphatase [Clostridia bacterium]|nr:SpoIIE family protein phosphatase [Clostridia bacterium]
MNNTNEMEITLVDDRKREGTGFNISVWELISRMVGFLLARAIPVQGLAPFGMSFLAMERSFSVRGLINFAFVCLGYLSQGGMEGLRYIIASAIYELFLFLQDKGKELSVNTAAILSGGAVTFCNVSAMLWWGFSSKGIFFTIVEFFMVILGVLAFDRCRHMILRGNMEIRSEDGRISLLILIGIALLSLQSITITEPVSVGNILGFLLISIASMGGLAGGTVAGIMIGMLLGVKTEILSSIAIFGFCGLVCSFAGRWKRLGIAVAVAISGAFLSLYALGAGIPAVHYLDSVIGGVLFLLIPKKICCRIVPLFSFWPERRAVQKEGMVRSRKKLELVADSFENLARTLDRLSDKKDMADMQEIGELFETVTDKVCRNCSRVKDCWNRNYEQTYQEMFRFLNIMERKGRLKIDEEETFLSEKCLQINKLARELNKQFEIYKINQLWKDKLCENRALVGEQFRGVADILVRLGEELGKEEEQLLENIQPVIAVEASKVSLAVDEKSGDAIMLSHLKEGKYLAVLSDGMGTGRTAGRQSEAIIDLLESFMVAGFDKSVAVKLINSVMVMKSAKEAFATVDMCMVDLYTGDAEFIKNGAQPSYIMRDDHVEIIRSTSLPVGLISGIETETFANKLNCGDVVVLVSDGMELKGEGERWIYQTLEEMSRKTEPDKIARDLLNKALELKEGKRDDDMSVIVMKIQPVKENLAVVSS